MIAIVYLRVGYSLQNFSNTFDAKLTLFFFLCTSINISQSSVLLFTSMEIIALRIDSWDIERYIEIDKLYNCYEELYS